MLLRLPLILSVLLLSIMGCEQQGKETDTTTSPETHQPPAEPSTPTGNVGGDGNTDKGNTEGDSAEEGDTTAPTSSGEETDANTTEKSASDGGEGTSSESKPVEEETPN